MRWGKIGRIDEMVRVYAAAKSKLLALDLYLAHLFILAFCGRVESVGSLLEHQLRSLAPEAKDYWTAIALKAGGGNDDAWRGLLTKLAGSAQDTTTSARRNDIWPRRLIRRERCSCRTRW